MTTGNSLVFYNTSSEFVSGSVSSEDENFVFYDPTGTTDYTISTFNSILTDNISIVLNCDYIVISAVPFDKVLLNKIWQLTFFYVTLFFLLTMCIRLICTLIIHKSIQTSGNIMIIAFIISDICVLAPKISMATILLPREKCTITYFGAYCLGMFNAIVQLINLYSITLLSVEKLLYINYAYQHSRVFCNLKRVLIYQFTGCFILTFCCFTIFYVKYDINVQPAMFIISPFAPKDMRIEFIIISMILTIIVIGSMVKMFLYVVKQNTTAPGESWTISNIRNKYLWKSLLSKAKSIIFPVTWMCFEPHLVFFYRNYVTNLPEFTMKMILVLALAARFIHPLFLIGGNKPLKDRFLNRSNNTPSWLLDIKEENRQRKKKLSLQAGGSFQGLNKPIRHISSILEESIIITSV